MPVFLGAYKIKNKYLFITKKGSLRQLIGLKVGKTISDREQGFVMRKCQTNVTVGTTTWVTYKNKNISESCFFNFHLEIIP